MDCQRRRGVREERAPRNESEKVSFDRVLIDPPRDGAVSVCQSIAALNDERKRFRPERIVYVSCNPSTLARDAGILAGGGHYRLAAAGVVNMFPHTSHVESMAVFERKD